MFPNPSLYAPIMLLAVGIGAALLRRFQGSLGLPASHRAAVGLGAFCGAMLGAKLPFVVSDWQGFLSGTAWFASGKTILCGMVGAYFGVELVKWILEIRVKTGDSFVVPVAVTIAIGRWGCLAAGCCFGTPTSLPWAMSCAAIDDIPRHPTQLYESLFHGVMAVLMWQLIRGGIWRGQLAKFYILSYLLYRFASEWLRPEPRTLGSLTLYQWFALALVPVFAYLWWRDAKALQESLPSTPQPIQATADSQSAD